jgi:hybrid cluster-associated redox disulfide protein
METVVANANDLRLAACPAPIRILAAVSVAASRWQIATIGTRAPLMGAARRLLAHLQRAQARGRLNCFSAPADLRRPFPGLFALAQRHVRRAGRDCAPEDEMESHEIDSSQTVAQVLRQWPASAAVFVRRGMACVGCSMAPFETLVEVASAYGEELSGFLTDLAVAVAEPRQRPSTTRPRGARPKGR